MKTLQHDTEFQPHHETSRPEVGAIASSAEKGETSSKLRSAPTTPKCWLWHTRQNNISILQPHGAPDRAKPRDQKRDERSPDQHNRNLSTSCQTCSVDARQGGGL